MVVRIPSYYLPSLLSSSGRAVGRVSPFSFEPFDTQRAKRRVRTTIPGRSRGKPLLAVCERRTPTKRSSHTSYSLQPVLSMLHP